MRRLIYFFAAFLLTLPVLFFGKGFFHVPVIRLIAPPPVSILQSGDLVLRRGSGLWALLARGFSDRDPRFSHIGILHDTKDGFVVFHANGDPSRTGSVKRETLEHFLKDSEEIAFYRYDFSSAEMNDILSWIFKAYEEKRPFDDDFSLETTDRLYCTELIWRAILEETGDDFAPEKRVAFKRPYIGLDDLFLHPRAQEVWSTGVIWEKRD